MNSFSSSGNHHSKHNHTISKF